MHMQRSRAQLSSAMPPRSIASAFEKWTEGEELFTLHAVWPVRIYTLGRFSILRDDQPLAFGAKTPKKPLELLKSMIALGGRLIDINDIMFAVWPDLGTAARPAFDIALLRLRKLLGNSAALILFDGKLTLNPQVCWVDAWAFERAIADLHNTQDQSNAFKALDLNRGPFLNREADTPSIAAARDRLASKFRRLVAQLGKREEENYRWEVAAQIYRRGIEQDNLAEDFYRGLMRCELRLGNCAETINTYRRCRDMLSIVLGVKPSLETESLYRKILEEEKSAIRTSVCEPISFQSVRDP